MTSGGNSAAPLILLAFDFGLRRIGLATGNTVSGQARALTTLTMTASGPDWVAIGKHIRDVGPSRLLVGAPYNEDGTNGPMTVAAAAFAAELGSRFPLPVEQVDERYSSLEAAAQLRDRRASGEHARRLTRGDVDSAAAAVILTSWLRARASGAGSTTTEADGR